jgi:hypothetical protein
MVFEYLTVSKKKKTCTDGQIFKNHTNSSKFFLGMTTGKWDDNWVLPRTDMPYGTGISDCTDISS